LLMSVVAELIDTAVAGADVLRSLDEQGDHFSACRDVDVLLKCGDAGRTGLVKPVLATRTNLNMRTLLSLLVACLATSSQAFGAEAARSHCGIDEVTYFNCVVEDSEKVASVCGSDLGAGAAAVGSYLQYRFGVIGNSEFEFPIKRTSPRNIFHFQNQSTRDGSTEDYFLWFRNGAWIYEIYFREEFENCGQTGCATEPADRAAFVSVWRGLEAWRSGDESRGKRLKCRNPEENETLKKLGEHDFYNAATRKRIFRRDED
jgi:hypothetical protein